MNFTVTSLLPEVEMINLIPNLQFKQKLNLEIPAEKLKKLEQDAKNLKLRFKKSNYVLPFADSVVESVGSSSQSTDRDAQPSTVVKKRKIVKELKINGNLNDCSMDELNQIISGLNAQSSLDILGNFNDADFSQSFEKSVKLVLIYASCINTCLENSDQISLDQKYYSDTVFKTIITTFNKGVELILQGYQDNNGCLEFSGDLEKLMVVLNDLVGKRVIPAQEIVTVSDFIYLVKMAFLGFSLIPIKSTAITKSLGIYSLQQHCLPLIVGIYVYYKEHCQFLIQETVSTVFKCHLDSQQPLY